MDTQVAHVVPAVDTEIEEFAENLATERHVENILGSRTNLGIRVDFQRAGFAHVVLVGSLVTNLDD